MPTINATTKRARDGVGIVTNQVTTVYVDSTAIQILIGGPYTLNNEEHTYGHVALRVISSYDEHVYDFGRYNGETGPFGQGRLRVWTSFGKYIAGENATGRLTTGFTYKISGGAAQQVNLHYKSLIGALPVKRAFGDYMKEYRLAEDYHALKNNCTTTSMAGARVAIMDLDVDVGKFNIGRGMDMRERAAAHIAGWPNYIFMPADLQKMLEANQRRRPEKIEQFGGKK